MSNYHGYWFYRLKNDEIISTGYNGAPRDRKNCLECSNLTVGYPTAYFCTPRVRFGHSKNQNKKEHFTMFFF